MFLKLKLCSIFGSLNHQEIVGDHKILPKGQLQCYLIYKRSLKMMKMIWKSIMWSWENPPALSPSMLKEKFNNGSENVIHTLGPGWHMMDSFGCFSTLIHEFFRISFFWPGSLNGVVRSDVVFSCFFKFRVPRPMEIWEKRKIEFIICQPGPKVWMTFHTVSQCQRFVNLQGFVKYYMG